MRWTTENVEELRQLMEVGNSWNVATQILSKRWDRKVTQSMVRTQAAKYGFGSSAEAPNIRDAPNVAELSECWTLSGDHMVAGDLHCPFLDWDMASNMAITARRYGVKSLLIVGDVFDMQYFSRFPAIVPNAPVGTEQDVAKYAIELWSNTFDEIRCLTGNHDTHFLRLLDGRLTEDTVVAFMLSMLGNAEKVKWSVYHHCLIDTPTGQWRATHPANYSRNALTVARKLAAKYLQHILVFHAHHTALGLDDSGQFIIANVGGLADWDKIPYVNLTDNSAHPRMNKGYAMLRNGKLRLFSDHPALGDV